MVKGFAGEEWWRSWEVVWSSGKWQETWENGLTGIGGKPGGVTDAFKKLEREIDLQFLLSPDNNDKLIDMFISHIGSQDAHILEVLNEKPGLEISDEDDDLDSLEMDYGENDYNDQQDINFDFGYNIMRGHSSQKDCDEESESDYEN
nr:hypothetical protein [Tanacetum cinerariifolium]